MEKSTIEHKEIQEWIEKHGGKPEKVGYHHAADGDSVALRINFPGPEDEEFLSDTQKPEEISWEDFFTLFDEQQLAFIYSDSLGAADLAYHFIGRENLT